MSTIKRKLLAAVGACLLAGLTAGAAAETKHDLYMCVLLSGQGQIMGGKAPAQSGVYRSTDRLTAEHVGFHHIRMFTVIGDPRNDQGLYMAALNGVVHTADLGQSWHILTGWDMTEPKGLAVEDRKSTRLNSSH